MTDHSSQALPIAPQYILDFEQMGLGMFVHFGLYSQLRKGEWVKHLHHIDDADYMPLVDTFNPVSMAEIVRVAQSAGCKYICLTTRHHDGFSLYDTCGLNDYDAPHALAGRDLVREFVDECRKADIVPFFYHTTLDWHHPDFNNDFEAYLSYLRQSVELLCTNYGKIGGLWFDGNWSRPNDDWQEDALYSMIRRLQPEAMIINNTGLHKRGEKGNEYIDSLTYERGLPTPIDRTGMTKYVAGEMCETLNDHWGDADDLNFKPIKQILEEICDCRKIGANMLLNIGPAGDGTVPLMARATMESVGYWMQIYGKAIYNGRPYIARQGQRDFILRDIRDPKTYYLFKYDLSCTGDHNVSVTDQGNGVVSFDGFEQTVSSIALMDSHQPLDFSQSENTLTVGCTGFPYAKNHCVRVAEIKTI
jgi:alpha-L-fucosidase